MRVPNWFVIVMGLLLANWCTLVNGNDTTCTSGAKVGSWVEIKSHRNDSGHWVSQVELINKDADAQRNSMDMDVNEYTFKCSNADGSKNGTTDKSFTATRVSFIAPGERVPRGEAVPGARFTAAARILGRGRVLFFSDTRLTWAEARRACHERGMRLADYSHSNAPAMSLLRRTQPGSWRWNVFVSGKLDSLRHDTDSHEVPCPTYDGLKITDVIPCTAKRPFFCQLAQ